MLGFWCAVRVCIFMIGQTIVNTEKHTHSTRQWRRSNKMQPWHLGVQANKKRKMHINVFNQWNDDWWGCVSTVLNHRDRATALSGQEDFLRWRIASQNMGRNMCRQHHEIRALSSDTKQYGLWGENEGEWSLKGQWDPAYRGPLIWWHCLMMTSKPG